MKRLSLIAISLLCCVNFASADMDSQLRALKSAQEEGEYQERAAINRAAKATAQREKQRQAALKAEREKREAKEKRDQEYEDKLRQLELEDRITELEEKKAMRKARAAKAEEFVAEDLNHAKATTDNIQAKSDAIRSNARGSENYLIKSGETDVKK